MCPSRSRCTALTLPGSHRAAHHATRHATHCATHHASRCTACRAAVVQPVAQPCRRSFMSQPRGHPLVAVVVACRAAAVRSPVVLQPCSWPLVAVACRVAAARPPACRRRRMSCRSRMLYRGTLPPVMPPSRSCCVSCRSVLPPGVSPADRN
jgi:hypothetical protein